MLKDLFTSEAGVTSIEYALLGALIAVAIIAALSATGQENGGIWGRWTASFLSAISP
ncbi:MAG: Flp family type IVb pilin [Hydrogenophaga sp.]|uniref:Flp family type IVb pilin n=1 Tax=Hydrogenophaga sp. TaxID=1904254 RepID=UPI002717BCC2|nr:Flp family type IVb pilin [Hydrogenophaga sp.]MDO9146657.1 Flp family type IVb pilin [Hydrogenophaga sp.]MDO9605564.1 Flp family type IVb pilin [Hydrogenophaga sp.]MDP2162775.1 Flp family type IVb pilin [Hydrogenophaga sp.]MDP3476946.1 Flp family type IVb pilin [Hydrogenophaga sp.]